MAVATAAQSAPAPSCAQERAGARAAAGGCGIRDLVTPLSRASPRLRFHRGGVAGGVPRIDPALPAIPGPPSDWYVAQWQQDTYLDAGDLSADTRPAPGGTGPVWRFRTPDGRTALAIEPGPGGTHAYVLSEDGGTLTASGGSNLFLATTVLPGPAGFDRPVLLSVEARVRAAAVSAVDPRARASGAVLAMAFVGLGAMNLDPRTGRRRFVFVQVPITGSAPPRDAPGYNCSLDRGEPALLYAVPAGPGETLAFRPSDGPSRPLPVRDLSAAIAAMIARPYPCGGTLRAWQGAERVLADWSLTGIYVGLEVENRDARAGAAHPAAQGQARLTLELSGLRIRRAG